MELPSTIRAFIAVRMNAAVEGALASLIDDLRRGQTGIRWARPDNFHITLRFLGDSVDSRRIGPLCEALGEVAAGTQAFEVAAKGVGAFPNLERPRVLWAGLEGADLLKLAQGVEAASVRCGFVAEPRPYSAHVTIARVQDSHGWRQMRQKFETAIGRNFGVSTITGMSLYRSILWPAGASHVEIGRFDFAAGAPKAGG